MTTENPGERQTLRASSPVDLLALVPTVLGFTPTESVTLLSFAGRRPFHARLDLPPPGSEDEAVQAIIEPVLLHSVALVAVVVHSRSRERAATMGRRLLRALLDAYVEVVEVVLTDGCWWAPLDDEHGTWQPYDVSAHPFVVESIVRGAVVHASRDDLAASLEPDEERVRRVAEVRRGLDPPSRSSIPWLVQVVRNCVEEARPPTEEECALLLTWLPVDGTVDAVVDLVERPVVGRHVDLWRAVLCAAPDGERDLPAVVVALCAWLSGHGALAWCALDRVSPQVAEHGLARAVLTALECALPPDAWWHPGVGDPA